MRKSNLLKKVVAIASALVLATVSVPMINGATDVKAENNSVLWIYERDGLNFPSEWNCEANLTSDKAADYTFGNYAATFEENVMLLNENELTSTCRGRKGLFLNNFEIKTEHDENTQTKRIAFTPSTSGKFEFFIVRQGTGNAEIRIYTINENNARDKEVVTASSGNKRDVEGILPSVFEATANEYFELYTNNGDTTLMAIRFTPASSSTPTADTTDKYTPTYVQYKAEDGGSYSIRIVYEIKAVYGEDKVLTNYTNLGAHLKVGSFEEDYYSTDGAKVYSKIMANGQEVSPTGDNNAFVVIEITGVPSNAEIGFSAIQQGGSDINASATIKMAEII